MTTAAATDRGYVIARFETRQLDRELHGHNAIAVQLPISGQPTVSELAVGLNEIGGVVQVFTGDIDSVET